MGGLPGQRVGDVEHTGYSIPRHPSSYSQMMSGWDVQSNRNDSRSYLYRNSMKLMKPILSFGELIGSL